MHSTKGKDIWPSELDNIELKKSPDPPQRVEAGAYAGGGAPLKQQIWTNFEKMKGGGEIKKINQNDQNAVYKWVKTDDELLRG